MEGLGGVVIILWDRLSYSLTDDRILIIDMYCSTVHTDCDCSVVSLTDQSIASIQGTPHTYDTYKTQDTHRQSQMLTSGSPTKNSLDVKNKTHHNQNIWKMLRPRPRLAEAHQKVARPIVLLLTVLLDPKFPKQNYFT